MSNFETRRDVQNHTITRDGEQSLTYTYNENNGHLELDSIQSVPTIERGDFECSCGLTFSDPAAAAEHLEKFSVDNCN